MSGLAGVVCWGGGPIADAAVARLAGAIAHRGLDGVHVIRHPGLAMIFARTVTTPEAVFERQPLVDEAAEVTLALDGRLDNREWLATTLGIDLPLSTVPDAALALAAYRRWGADCAGRLLGDFGLVVWDGRRRRLFVARDVMGVRPLYYRRDRNAFAWASEQRALADGGVNEGYVAEVLASRVVSCHETIHRHVMRLPMAHALTADPDGAVRCWRYWRPPAGAAIRYRDARQYEEHFRDVLLASVRTRLRLAGGAALLLSGGIDSSSIAAAIAALQDEGCAAASRVDTFSMVVPGHPADEAPGIRAVIDRTGLPSMCYPPVTVAESDFASDAAASLDLPAARDPLQQAAARRGHRVVLSGLGGDEWFTGSAGDLADLLRGARIAGAAAWVRSAARRSRRAWATELRMGAWMAVPERVKPWVRRALGRRAVPPWIGEGFAAAVALDDRLRARPDRVELGSIGSDEIFSAATNADAAFHNEQGERAAARDGLEERHPFYDRRMIELALAIPPEIRCAGGTPKGIVRRAMAGMLPAVVTRPAPPADFGFLFVEWLDTLGGAGRICRSRPCVRGWVRRDAIEPMYGAMARGVTRYLWPLWAAFAVDVWLPAVEASAGDFTEVP